MTETDCEAPSGTLGRCALSISQSSQGGELGQGYSKCHIENSLGQWGRVMGRGSPLLQKGLVEKASLWSVFSKKFMI